MKQAFLFIILFNTSFAFAQKMERASDTTKKPFICAYPIDMYPSPKFDFNRYLTDNLRYPDSAVNAGIDGTVWIQFVVNEKGAIKDAKVIRGIGYGCDEEALRMIEHMPRWKPGKEYGKQVKTTMIQPIKFILE